MFFVDNFVFLIVFLFNVYWICNNMKIVIISFVRDKLLDMIFFVCICNVLWFGVN